jgi:hypothetical protein
MRHFIGLILGLVLAAALFFGGGWGAEHVSALAGHSVGLPSRTGLIGLAAVLGVGLFMGILIAVPAVSPLATGLPGLALLGWTALLVVNAGHAVRLIPMQGHTFATGFGDMLTTGVLAVAGAAMIVPLFVPSRWRRRYVYDDYADEPAGIGLMR